MKKNFTIVLAICTLSLLGQAQNITPDLARIVYYMKYAQLYDSSKVYQSENTLRFKSFYIKDTTLNGYTLRSHNAFKENNEPFFKFYYGGKFANDIIGLMPYVEKGRCPVDMDNPDWNNTVERISFNQLLIKNSSTSYTYTSNPYCSKTDSIIVKVDYTINNTDKTIVTEEYTRNTNNELELGVTGKLYYSVFNNSSIWYLDSVVNTSSKTLIDYGVSSFKELYFDSFGVIDSLGSKTYTWADTAAKPFVINVYDMKNGLKAEYFFKSYAQASKTTITSLSNDKFKKTYFVSPNPVKDVLHLNIGSASTVACQVYDMLGKEYVYLPLTNNNLDVSSLTTGFYILKFNVDNEVNILKFIKE